MLYAVLPYISEQILRFVGDDRKAVELHHGGGAFDGVHYPEDFVYAVFVEAPVFFAFDKYFIKMFEQVVCFEKVNVEH